MDYEDHPTDTESERESAAAPDAAPGQRGETVIEGRNISLSFYGSPVLCDISFKVAEGESLAIVGGSGVGKSTILKLILRLLVPDGGQILIEREDINQLTFQEVLKVRQKMGMVFQAAALFDSLTVFENVAYPLREHTDLAEREIVDHVGQALTFVDLSLKEFGGRLPAELSGGQKKRVGIARAIANRPSILLYDEPTTGLDPMTSRTIVDLIKRLQHELEVTSVVVSHNVRAVLAVATRIAMLRDCRIVFYGTPDEMLSSEDHYVREFIE